jgi:hypothetical protein
MEGNDGVSLGAHSVIAATDMALKVREDIDGCQMKPFWVPKSVIHDDSEVYASDTTGDLVVYAWWAEAEGYL